MDEVSSELLEAMDKRITIVGCYLVGVIAALPPPKNSYEIEADSVLTQALPIQLKAGINERLRAEMLTKEQRKSLLKALDTIDERMMLLKTDFEKRLH
ncbi:hypothetical protein DSA75_26095 [Salmonella enterica subsp. enterica serovar Typhimurium]|nr:hypothetical protein [Salmonella enterica subsp. enterica serovar Typhimurium]ECB6911737.1 hypothetical protein [Salmonella enterica subsp. enterica serovar Kingston]ECN8003141.1 hypothetical protein [Salmonella enterica subsp. enterica serovar Kentucky]EEA0533678.1 hypothetical protein [Salmonella enterica subsp. enterica serovar Montevideo]HCQ4163593.1 hypothetical protein [Escherichia coli]